ncbi:MAG: alpha-L-fucosidase [Caldilineaceae bacterium]|nr:alpha-L-fucosidase [Caldilineaceae bacterium]
MLPANIRPATGDADWFIHDRFGLFIHWGLYALPARHEWVKNRERLSDEAYQKYFDHFDPDLYDPVAWARAAKAAGMKYFVITTKHHEGFCLWDSAHTDYKATNTPYGRDLLRPMVEAFRAEGLKIGFYHSVIDWHHPEFPVDMRHPMRDNSEYREATKGRDVQKYADYLHAQVRELLTGFGKIDMIFYDFSYPGADGKGRDDWRSEELIAMTRELQPGILVNDRLDLMDKADGWDYRTPEQVVVQDWVRVNGQPVLWETCQTFSGSWGYHRDESSWKSVDQLIRMLIDTVSNGGNLLLNVGPTARGEFDDRALERLRGMGEWMRRHGRSIYSCTQAPKEFPVPDNCRLTYNPATHRLYIHIYAWPYRELHLPGMVGKVAYAQLLNDASELPMIEREEWQDRFEDKQQGALILQLPVQQPDVTVPVVELFLK